MSLPWILVCPSSRGLGFAVTRHLLRNTSLPILATTRREPTETKSSILSDLKSSSSEGLDKRLTVVLCDVTDDSSVADAAKKATETFPTDTHHLRLACTMPGVLHPEKSPRQVDADSALDSFRVNSLGPLLLMKHFSDFLPRRANTDLQASPDSDSIQMPLHTAVWLSVAARVGSTTDNRAGGWFSYRASKAAVISLCKTLDLRLEARSGDRALAVSYHPGTVKTEFSREFWGGVPEGKLFGVEYAAEKLVGVATGLGAAQRGRCWDWKNEEVPP